jgi:hypothetical protein
LVSFLLADQRLDSYLKDGCKAGCRLNKMVWSLAIDVDLAPEGGVFGGKKRELLHRVRQSEYVPVANCGLYAINQVL